MKKFKVGSVLIISAVFFVSVLASPITSFAATSPSLGASSTYAITSSTYTNSLNAALETAITGDICYTTGPGTTPVSISGATVVPCAPARGTDQSSALASVTAQANDVSCTNLGTNVVLAGTYTPGCYTSSGTMDIVLNGTVTLNGAGTYIFRSGGALTTGANSTVALTGGASACDVFWAPGGATHIGANSSTSPTPTFVGTILQNSLNAFDVTIGHFVNLSGRILAFGRTVTTDSNTISIPTGCTPTPPTLSVIKHVVNSHGGTAVASAWALAVTSSNGGSGAGSAAGSESGTVYTLQAGKAYSVAESGGPSGYLEADSTDCTIANAVAGTVYTCTITNHDIAPQLIVSKIVVGGTKVPTDFSFFIDGSGVTPGVSNTLLAGAHTVSETPDAGYTASVWGGNCAANGTITLAPGDIKTCTITNTVIGPVVSSPSGGAGLTVPPPVPPLISVVKVPSPLALPNGPGNVTYTYTLRNVGTVPVSNITMVDDSCSPLAYVSGDANNDSKLDLNETWTYQCATTLSATHTNTVVATGWANGISTVDIANATVIVGAPIVPPLIHVTKVPNPLLLSTLGGTVTYTETVTNPGTVPLSNVSLTDDKCNPVAYVSGDTNNDSKLDSNETWVYTCTANLAATITNTATATGQANGLTAKDFAIATVVVAVPGLPKTGFPPQAETNNLVLLVGVLLFISSTIIIVLEKNI